MNIALYVLCLVVSIALHELGHAGALRRAGRAPTAIHIGIGPVLWKRGALHVHAAPILGYVTAPAAAPDARTRDTLACILAGCAANLLLGVALLGAYTLATPAARTITLQEALTGAERGSAPLGRDGKPLPNTPEGHDELQRQMSSGTLTVRTPAGETRTVETNTQIVALNAPPAPATQVITARTVRATKGTWEAAAITAQAAAAGDAQRIRERGLSTPIGAARVLAEQKVTLSGTLLIAAVINLGMAAFNAIPIPPLDGGVALITAAERLCRRRLSDAARASLTLVGAAIILSLIGAAFWADITA